jgi:GNAT superfamily N-acetyltransferase
VVGTGALVVERKFIHNLGLVGHIEDIAVAKDQQGKKLGLRIIQALDYVAEKVGCYKVRAMDFTFATTMRMLTFWNLHSLFSIALKPMRAFISSVALDGQVWKWHTIMVRINQREDFEKAFDRGLDIEV